MNEQDKVKLEEFFKKLERSEDQQIRNMVDTLVDREIIKQSIKHVQEYYGPKNDRETSKYVQLMITGFMISKVLE